MALQAGLTGTGIRIKQRQRPHGFRIPESAAFPRIAHGNGHRRPQGSARPQNAQRLEDWTAGAADVCTSGACVTGACVFGVCTSGACAFGVADAGVCGADRALPGMTGCVP